MSIDKIAVLVLGALIMAWPAVIGWVKRNIESLPHAPTVLPQKATYIAAIENLGLVRTRLVQTECLGEQQKAAIDTLTLALVSGSEK